MFFAMFFFGFAEMCRKGFILNCFATKKSVFAAQVTKNQKTICPTKERRGTHEIRKNYPALRMAEKIIYRAYSDSAP